MVGGNRFFSDRRVKFSDNKIKIVLQRYSVWVVKNSEKIYI